MELLGLFFIGVPVSIPCDVWIDKIHRVQRK